MWCYNQQTVNKHHIHRKRIRRTLTRHTSCHSCPRIHKLELVMLYKRVINGVCTLLGNEKEWQTFINDQKHLKNLPGCPAWRSADTTELWWNRSVESPQESLHSACSALSPSIPPSVSLFFWAPSVGSLFLLSASSGSPWPRSPSSRPVFAWWAKDGRHTVTVKPAKRIWSGGGGLQELAAATPRPPTGALQMLWLAAQTGWKLLLQNVMNDASFAHTIQS